MQRLDSPFFFNVGRGVLLAAILLLFILLVREWVTFSKWYGEEFPRQNNAGMEITSTETDNIPPPAEIETNIPSALPSSAAQRLEEIPQAWETNPSGDQSPAAYFSEAEQIIRIFSDTLHLQINLQGGDIVSLALPKHPVSLQTPEIPYPLLEERAAREYIAQSGLVGRNGTDQAGERPKYSAAQSEYILQEAQQELYVPLHYQSEDGVHIEKYFLLRRGSYDLEIGYRIDNRSTDPWQANMFAQFKRDQSPDPYNEEAIFAPRSFLGVAVHTPEKPYKKLDFSDLRKNSYQRDLESGWIAMVQHYFVAAWIPEQKSRSRYRARINNNGSHLYAGLTSTPLELAPGESGVTKLRLYAGPKTQQNLKPLASGLELTVDYGFLFFISQPLFLILQWLHSLIGNWGWSIVGLTLMVKLIFYPLSNIGYRSMANMRSLQPKLQALRERYPDDRQKMSAELMNLYRKEKINPMGGCLPILVQMPVFLALYWVLLESVELRHAPFVWWIQDLSQMDPWFILPLLMGASMFAQQKLNPTPPDPLQARIMQWLPVVFTFFFLFFPAGLVLYWLVNNLLSILQQWFVVRKTEQAAHKA